MTVNASSIVQHVIQITNWNNDTSQSECKNYYRCKKDYSSNSSTCICENNRYGHTYLILCSALPAQIVFICTNNAASKSIILPCILFFIKIWKTTQYNLSKISCTSEFKRYYSLSHYFFDYFCFVSTLFYFRKLSSSFVVYLTSCKVISKSSQSYIRFEVIYYPMLNIFWIYWMLIYAFILTGVRTEFPRYTKISYKLELHMT